MPETLRQENNARVWGVVLEVWRSDLGEAEKQCLRDAMTRVKFLGFSVKALHAKILSGMHKAGLIPPDFPAWHQRSMVHAYCMSAWEG